MLRRPNAGGFMRYLRIGEDHMNETKSRKPARDKAEESPDKPRPESLPHGTTKDQIAEMESEGQAQQSGNNEPAKPAQDEREGATDEQVGDRIGPGAGYDIEPEQEKDGGGVA
jgi:hypothetical protein